MRVALICMPFSEICSPSISLSLLQAGLKRQDVPCDIYYLNLLFASRIGCVSYWKLGVDSPPDDLAGEWLFAEELFGKNSHRDREYLETVRKRYRKSYFRGETLRRLQEVRGSVAGYLDACFERVPWDEYDVIGFTSTFSQTVGSLALAKRVKEAFPEKKIAFGGANCEDEMGIELHRQFPFVDFVCSGQGDRAFPELVRRLSDGEDTTGIAGIISRVGGDTVAPREMVSSIVDMDSLPIPSYDDYFEQRKEISLNRCFTVQVPFETARGCWWGAKMHCTFCGLNGATMGYRSKSPQRALDEVLYLAEKYGTQLNCVDAILDLQYLDWLMPELAKRGLPLKMFFETKVNLTKKQLRVLRDAGVRAVQPGVESFSTPILRLMKKGCTRLQNVQFLKWAKELGIDARWNFLYGFPGETASEYSDMARIIGWLSHLQPPQGTGRIRMDRFNPYFMRPAEYGITNVRAQETYAAVYPFPREVLSRLAYYFDYEYGNNEFIENYARPAVEKVTAWKAARYRGNLTGKVEHGSLVLTDTRKRGRKAARTVLRGPVKAAYIFCDAIHAFPAILAHVSAACGEPVTADWLERELDHLISEGLMLKEGRSYLSLAILDVPAWTTDAAEPVSAAAEPAAALTQLAVLPALVPVLQTSCGK